MTNCVHEGEIHRKKTFSKDLSSGHTVSGIYSRTEGAAQMNNHDGRGAKQLLSTSALLA